MSQETQYPLPLKGGCFCKEIRYEIKGEPLRAGVCHCKSCQHLTGGSCWPFLVLRKEAVEIQGTPQEISRRGGSGKEISMYFCSFCGSTLFGKPQLWPQIITVSASSLDDRHIFSPTFHVWTKEAQSWIQFDPECTQFFENRGSS